MTKTNFAKVGEFMKIMGQEVRTSPMTELDKKIVNLRMVLIAEEAGELGDEFLNLFDFPEDTPKFYNIAKELADLLYVVYGTGHAFGIDLDKCFDEVHNSNLSKLGDDGKPIYREDGKVAKGPNYKPPSMMNAIG